MCGVESNAVQVASEAGVTGVINLIKTSVSGVFEIAGSAFTFLMANPLAAFMVGSGFAFTALSCIRKALRVAKRT